MGRRSLFYCCDIALIYFVCNSKKMTTMIRFIRSKCALSCSGMIYSENSTVLVSSFLQYILFDLYLTRIHPLRLKMSFSGKDPVRSGN